MVLGAHAQVPYTVRSLQHRLLCHVLKARQVVNCRIYCTSGHLLRANAAMRLFRVAGLWSSPCALPLIKALCPIAPSCAARGAPVC